MSEETSNFPLYFSFLPILLIFSSSKTYIIFCYQIQVMGCGGSKAQDIKQDRNNAKGNIYICNTSLSHSSLLKKSKLSTEAGVKLIDKVVLATRKNPCNITLVFRASEHKFSSKSFHSSCDGKDHTIVICNSANNNLFGGYTPCKWVKDECLNYSEDAQSESFLFSVEQSGLEFHALKQEGKQKAIMNDDDLGPIFGEGHDLHISDRADVNHSWSNLGKSYECQFKFGSVKGNSLIAKQEKFLLKQFQVWQLAFK